MYESAETGREKVIMSESRGFESLVAPDEQHRYDLTEDGRALGSRRERQTFEYKETGSVYVSEKGSPKSPKAWGQPELGCVPEYKLRKRSPRVRDVLSRLREGQCTYESMTPPGSDPKKLPGPGTMRSRELMSSYDRMVARRESLKRVQPELVSRKVSRSTAELQHDEALRKMQEEGRRDYQRAQLSRSYLEQGEEPGLASRPIIRRRVVAASAKPYTHRPIDIPSEDDEEEEEECASIDLEGHSTSDSEEERNLNVTTDEECAALEELIPNRHHHFEERHDPGVGPTEPYLTPAGRARRRPAADDRELRQRVDEEHTRSGLYAKMRKGEIVLSDLPPDTLVMDPSDPLGVKKVVELLGEMGPDPDGNVSDRATLIRWEWTKALKKTRKKRKTTQEASPRRTKMQRTPPRKVFNKDAHQQHLQAELEEEETLQRWGPPKNPQRLLYEREIGLVDFIPRIGRGLGLSLNEVERVLHLLGDPIPPADVPAHRDYVRLPASPRKLESFKDILSFCHRIDKCMAMTSLSIPKRLHSLSTYLEMEISRRVEKAQWGFQRPWSYQEVRFFLVAAVFRRHSFAAINERRLQPGESLTSYVD
ncbi:MAG: hypothetical protein AAFY74_20520, partial [Pseudomonadota bacterium]